MTRGTIISGSLSWCRLRAHWPGVVHKRTAPWSEIEYMADLLECFREGAL